MLPARLESPVASGAEAILPRPRRKPMKSYRLPIALCCLGAALFAAALYCGCSSSTAAPAKQHPAAAAQPAQAIQPAAEAATQEDIPLAVQIYFRPLPDRMPGSEHDTPELIALGRQLYFEPAMSINRKQSCNDCHMLDSKHAGTDNLPTSKGAMGSLGKRNAPTVLNAGFHVAQFWDGRAADLVEQAKGPVLNPVEMGMHTPEEVVDRLKDMHEYCQAFEAAFPGEKEPITYDNVAMAIAAFERTLITPSRFDRYLKGDTSALTAEEKQGLHRFVHTDCVQCHSSITVGGRLFEKLGVNNPYSNQEDAGRFAVTKVEEDRLIFKVPSLRNVTLTEPYFHDGQVSCLTEAVRLMAWMQLNAKLNPDEIDEIVCFLRTLEAEKPIDLSTQ
jgi:cytochrome c peroxidase